jgi:hypothetical protein
MIASLRTIQIRAATIMLCLQAAPCVEAQWLEHRTIGLPRTASGEPDIDAAPQRRPDGRPDLSGIWIADPGERPSIGGVGNVPRSPYFLDVTSDIDPSEAPLLPWTRAEFDRRRARNSMDDPTARCQPTGIPGLHTTPIPFKVVQLPELIVILFEKDVDFRQIFMDGRTLPTDPNPAFNGYSVGRWEGDTLIVESSGFNDTTWLDRFGHPHTHAMKLTERFRRLTIGRMELEITIDDAGAFTAPITFTQPLVLMPDTELLEHYCIENERSAQHFE